MSPSRRRLASPSRLLPRIVSITLLFNFTLLLVAANGEVKVPPSSGPSNFACTCNGSLPIIPSAGWAREVVKYGGPVVAVSSVDEEQVAGMRPVAMPTVSTAALAVIQPPLSCFSLPPCENDSRAACVKLSNYSVYDLGYFKFCVLIAKPLVSPIDDAVTQLPLVFS